MSARYTEVKTEEVIKALEENKVKHLEEYDKAKKAYKLEVLEQLEQIHKDVSDGKFGLCLDLVEPIDNSEWYEDSIRMFTMEQKEVIKLDNDEFRKYVLDKGSNRAHSKMSNQTYFGKFNM